MLFGRQVTSLYTNSSNCNLEVKIKRNKENYIRSREYKEDSNYKTYALSQSVL